MAQCLSILAPAGRDAEVIAGILASATIRSEIASSPAHVIAALDDKRVGGLIVAEEALTASGVAALEAWLAAQPPWSDLPVLLLTMRRTTAARPSQFAERLGNVTILERPLHPVTLVSAARAALRARARQRDAETYIAEREARAAELRASEARLRAVMDAVPVAILFAQAPSGRIAGGNAYAETIFRHPIPSSAGIDAYGAWVAARGDGQPVAADEFPLARALASGDPAEGVYRYTRGDGTEAWMRVQAAPMTDAGGAVTGGVVAVSDIDELVRTREALERLNAELEARVAAATAERDRAWNNAQDLLVVLDGCGSLRATNPAWTKILGWQPSELAGRHFVDLIHPDDRAASRAALMVATTDALPRHVTRYRHSDGSYRDIEWAAMPEGELIYATGRDITAEKAARAELERAQAQMHEMAKLETLGQLTGGVAHDFNNLLTPIVASLDLLRRRLGDDERAARLISGALDAAERAALLVQRLLTFARRQHLEARAINVSALIDGMRDLVARSIGSHIAVEVAIASDLPAARIDPNQLELAVLNLCVNARDAMPGGGTLRISLDQAVVTRGQTAEIAPGRYLRLSVSDNGTGMDEATLKRAIEPFFSTKGPGRGTGLGLSMVHGLAAQSGGALTLTSQPGVGTSAVLWLPVSEQAAVALPALDTTPAAQPRQAMILLVDDETLVRAATAEMLRELGHRVVEAGSGLTALGKLRAGLQVDLLITDHLMPQMRGSELIAEATKLRPSLPALLITGYANLSDDALPGLPRLAKPFRAADLARQVALLLEASPRAAAVVRGDRRASG